MRTLIIGDIHGHTTWKEIIENETYDNVVILGDYVDSFTVKPKDQYENLRELFDLKKKNPDKVTLIYGNHDHSYYADEKCSGYNEMTYFLCYPILESMMSKGMLVPVYVQDGFIFSHAGVSKFWLENVAKVEKPEDITFENVELVKFGHNYCEEKRDYIGYGDTISQSPIWIRPRSLRNNLIKGYKQIVGHTNMKKPEINEKLGVYVFDCMPYYYGILEDGIVKSIKNI